MVKHKSKNVDRSPKATTTVSDQFTLNGSVIAAIPKLSIATDEIANMLALLGNVAGHSERPIGSDATLIEHVCNLVRTDFQRAMSGPDGDRVFVAAEIFSDIGITSSTCPIVHVKGVADQLNKAFAANQIDSFTYVRSDTLLDHPTLVGGRAIITSCRMIVSLEAGKSMDDVRHVLAKAKVTCQIGEPINVVRLVSAAELPKAIGWMFHTLDRPLQLSEPVDGRPRFKVAKRGYGKAAALRILECLSLTEIRSRISGVGRGKTLASTVCSKATAFQRGRVPDGVVIGRDFDTWAFWTLLRREQKDDRNLPFRFDVTVRVPKPKTAPKRTTVSRRSPPRSMVARENRLRRQRNRRPSA